MITSIPSAAPSIVPSVAPIVSVSVSPALIVPVSTIASASIPTITSVTIGVPPLAGPQPTSVTKKMPRGINFLEVAPMTVSGTVYYVISNTAHI